ncbi:uncharacterized protein BX664DRAFT_72335 [Halteromyces radiatus]|uniref:uncharacterized protein n=1 Tax=Halteromyces radiatus TaxID=101107 RepID=UPI0022212775|nr:uncharacterized protein BX664DRAFT_72335 [Halteromyces radiatus]KAI8097068.1 hypothetical protein BX664DRAFT_72335 [Halteromyces radiatus]
MMIILHMIILFISQTIMAQLWWNTPFSNQVIQQVTDHGLDLFNGLQLKQKDCFKKATLSLEKECQQIGFDQQNQMKYALMLTLCELETAQISIPLECHHPTLYLQVCITKLASIPQTWTTYSGYFRDVSTICFAIRYPLEKELLQQAQQNMTLYQTKYYNMLQQQQLDMIEWRNQEMKLLDTIRLQQFELWSEFNHLQDHSSDEMNDLISIIRETKHHASDIYANQQMLTKANQHYFNQINQYLINILNHTNHEFTSIYTKMEIMSLWQNETMTKWLHWQEVQHQLVQQWQTSVNDANQTLSHLLDMTEHQLKSVQYDINNIQTDLRFIIQPIQWLYSCMLELFYYTYYIKSTFGWISNLICFCLMIKSLYDCQQQYYPILLLPLGKPVQLLTHEDHSQHISTTIGSTEYTDRLELYYRLVSDE